MTSHKQMNNPGSDILLCLAAMTGLTLFWVGVAKAITFLGGL